MVEISNTVTFDSSKHPVAAVTVFQQDRADVKRIIDVELKVMHISSFMRSYRVSQYSLLM